ncbi:MAG: hypothetical protein HY341_00240 [Candidatus Kerfeldbacteria bacterium]|nr:hypothetical protein [Candidatus Kerfeldbacteria bacterium]
MLKEEFHIIHYSNTPMKTLVAVLVGAGLVVAIALVATRRESPPPAQQQQTVRVETVRPGAFGAFTDASPTATPSFDTGAAGLRQAADEATGEGSTEPGAVTVMPEPVPEEIISTVYVLPDGPITIPSRAVLKRDATSASAALTQTLRGSSFAGLSLSSFSDLEIDTLTASEQREGGYTISIEPVIGVVSLYRNFGFGGEPVPMKTFAEERAALLAPDDPGLTVADLPSDETLIGAADGFLDRYGIDRSAYGDPVVRNDWLAYATGAAREGIADAAALPIASDVAVVYPLVVQDAPVYDESGLTYGLNVNVAVSDLTVSGMWNLAPLSFQASTYELTRDEATIRAAVERGGLYGSGPVEGATRSVTVTLGAPTDGYLASRWQIGDGSSEYLIPTLFFPVVSVSDDTVYVPTTIIVPLVPDILSRATTVSTPVESTTVEPSVTTP